MYWGYKTDEWFGDYDYNLLKDRVMPRSHIDKSTENLINIYKEELSISLGMSLANIELISSEINKILLNKIYDIIITIPSFYKEEGIIKTITEVQNQIFQIPNKNVLLLVYNNGYEDVNSDISIKKKEKEINNILNTQAINNMQSICISNLYQNKPFISRVRSDIFDSLILSDVSKCINDKTIYLSFDADVRKIEDWYIQELIDKHNQGYQIVVSDKNWTFEHEKYDDLYLYLQEKIFLLGDEYIYNRLDDNDLSTITNGRSSSFIMRSLLLIKGYERDFHSADDTIIGHKLNRFYGDKKKNKNIAGFVDKKIRSDGSRGSEIISKGKMFFEQWNPDFFDTKEERSTKKEYYKDQNKILLDLIKGEHISNESIKRLESVYAQYINYFLGKNDTLNTIYIEKLLELLKDFFGDICIYKFTNDIEVNTITITEK